MPRGCRTALFRLGNGVIDLFFDLHQESNWFFAIGMVGLREAAKSNEETRDYDPPVAKHPVCPTCGVPMWLTLIERIPDSPMLKDRLHYECKVCETKAIVPR